MEAKIFLVPSTFLHALPGDRSIKYDSGGILQILLRVDGPADCSSASGSIFEHIHTTVASQISQFCLGVRRIRIALEDTWAII